jgi:hypothetical protein
MPGFKKEALPKKRHHGMSLWPDFRAWSFSILFLTTPLPSDERNPRSDVDLEDPTMEDGGEARHKRSTISRMNEMRENRSRNRKCRTETTNAITENLLCD